MFDRSTVGRSARLLLFASCSFVSTRVANAQSTAEYRHLVDSLGTIWRSQARELALADSTRRSLALRDTLHVGHFVIVADSQYASIARIAAERVSPLLDRAYGKFAGKLDSRVFAVRAAPRKGDTTHVIESGILDDNGLLRFSSRDFADAGALARSWQTKAAALISESLPLELWGWVNQPIPIEELTTSQINADHVELVLSASQASHDCAMGSVPRCMQALGLMPTTDPAFELFNREQRNDMIEHNSTRFRRADPARYARCMVAHVQATCDSLVHDIPVDAVPLAVATTVRRSLLRYALKLGGPGAFDRLATATGSVGDRLAAAAGVPIDSVTKGWQQTLMKSQSVSNALDLQTALSAALWAAACCALALRSSRWR